MLKNPNIVWYQTFDKIIIKIYINEINSKYTLLQKGGNLIFYTQNENGDKVYSFNIELENSFSILKHKNNERYVSCILKKDTNLIWDYLTTDKSFTKNYIKIDWNNWKDYDHEEINNYKELINLDESKLTNSINRNEIKNVKELVNQNFNKNL
jgi:hypothetical protein